VIIGHGLENFVVGLVDGRLGSHVEISISKSGER
jgi:hypothetical protein